MRLYSSGTRVTVICRTFGISSPVFYEDMKALAALKNPIEALQEIMEGMREIRRRALNRRDLNIALETLIAQARVAGLMNSDPAIAIQNNNLVSGDARSYDQLPDDELQTEYQRRLLLRAGKGVK